MRSSECQPPTEISLGNPCDDAFLWASYLGGISKPVAICPGGAWEMCEMRGIPQPANSMCESMCMPLYGD